MQRLKPSPLPRVVAGAATTALTILAVASPTAASAFAIDMYDVEVDATVETTYTGDATSTQLEHHAALIASTRLTSRFLASIERAADGRIIGANGADHHVASTSATVTTTEREYDPDWNDWWQRGTTCTGAGENRNDRGRTSLISDPLTPLVGAAFTLNLADELEVALHCTDTGRNGGAGPRSFSIESALSDEIGGPNGPLAVDFDLPPEATAAGKVIQRFEGPAAGREGYCPTSLAEQPYMTSCRVRFSGTISLTKIRLGDPTADVTGAPSPVVPPGAPPVAAKVPAERPSAPAVSRTQRASWDAKASGVRFRAACSGGCTGTATFRVPAPRRGEAKLRRVASASFRVPKATSVRTVRVTVPKAARRLLRDARGAVVDLRLRDRESGRTTPVRLKLAR